MRDGVVVEYGPAKQVIDNPQQIETKCFFSRFHDATPRSADLQLTA
jgi:polar amino acid transport system ATP-binding protein